MGFFGGGGGGTGGGPYTVITTTSTLESQKSYMVDTSSSAYTVTLPAAPANGDYVEIFDRANTFNTNNLTIARNGSNIESLAEDLTANVNGAAFKLAYADSTTGWQIIPFYGFAGPTVVGATTGSAGTAGVVPAPSAGKNTRALFSNATFGEIPWLPQYKNTASGNYIMTANIGASVSGATLGTAKQRRFALIYVPADGSVDVLGYRTSTAPTSSINCHVAMWNVGENGEPSTFVCGGTAASGTTADTTITVSISPSVAVSRGFYYISHTPESAMSSTSILCVSASDNVINACFIGVANISLGAQSFVYTATTYNQTTHEVFTLSAVAVPRMGFQYV